MASTFELEIATPERLLVREAVTDAQIPGANGELGILPGHAPLLSELGIGVLRYTVNGQPLKLTISGGIVQVLPDRVRVLALTAERPAEIDSKRAREAERRASERLANMKDNVDYARALNALRRAQSRLAAQD
jgi:F-type H+-transporting ATPase subunit epsilon